MRRCTLVMLLCCCVAASVRAEDLFVKQPRIAKAEDVYLISFELKKPSDIVVGVVDKDGRVVRHIGGGMIGGNAPEPFAKDSLAQTVCWDGTADDGEAVPPGCRVKLAAGLQAEFERILFELPEGLASRGPVGIACDENGLLYVLEGGGSGVGTLLNLKVFDREGNAVSKIVPFRADWPAEELSAIEWLTTKEGRRVPLTGPNNHRPFSGFLRGLTGMRQITPLITKDNRLVMASGRYRRPGDRRRIRSLLSVGTNGSATKEFYYGPLLPENAWMSRTWMTQSRDGAYIYVSGQSIAKKGTAHAVYRIRWNDEGFAKPWAGVECEKGDDNKHFHDPRGLACDSKDRLYVGDYMNDRIQVFSKDGTYLKTFQIRGPDQILVNPKTDEIYVLSVEDRGKLRKYIDVRWEVYGKKSIVKFRSFDNWREISRIALPDRERYFHDSGPVMCLDAVAENPIIWVVNVGRQEPGDFLWKIVDKDGGLKKVEHKVARYHKGSGRALGAQIASCRRSNSFYVVHKGIWRHDAATGEKTKLPMDHVAKRGIGDIAVGPKGMLYVSSAHTFPMTEEQKSRVVRYRKPDRVWRIRRYTLDGKRVDFKAGEYVESIGFHWGPTSAAKPGPFCVAPDGKIYTGGWRRQFILGKGTPWCRMDCFGADGRLLKRGFIEEMSRSVGDVATDGFGNLYVATTVKPRLKGMPEGSEYPPFMGADPRKHFSLWYGSVYRFDPDKGGTFEILTKQDADKATHWGYRRTPMRVKGALWEYYGVSPLTQSANCECVLARMDGDGFGRLFIPDTCGSAIRVLDSAGNLLNVFGEYGNSAARGPGSPVPRPAIPLFGPQSVAVVDDHAAIVDRLNRRILEVALKYRSETLLDVP